MKVDLASIFNQKHAINTGWEVESFALGTVQDQNGDAFMFNEGDLRIVIELGIRDVDAHILRLSYNVSILGEVAPFTTRLFP